MERREGWVVVRGGGVLSVVVGWEVCGWVCRDRFVLSLTHGESLCSDLPHLQF